MNEQEMPQTPDLVIRIYNPSQNIFDIEIDCKFIKYSKKTRNNIRTIDELKQSIRELLNSTFFEIISTIQNRIPPDTPVNKLNNIMIFNSHNWPVNESEFEDIIRFVNKLVSEWRSEI